MKEIFDSEDREFITSLIQSNCESLNNIPEYIKAKEKLDEIQKQFLEEPNELLENYEKYYNIMLDYQLCMVYYIGVDKGMHYNNVTNSKQNLHK